MLLGPWRLQVLPMDIAMLLGARGEVAHRQCGVLLGSLCAGLSGCRFSPSSSDCWSWGAVWPLALPDAEVLAQVQGFLPLALGLDLVALTLLAAYAVCT